MRSLGLGGWQPCLLAIYVEDSERGLVRTAHVCFVRLLCNPRLPLPQAVPIYPHVPSLLPRNGYFIELVGPASTMLMNP